MTTVYNYIHDVLKPINSQRSTPHVEKARHTKIDYWVLVESLNIQVKAGNNKSCTCKWLEPYKVIKAIDCHAYQLEVPEGTRCHNLVHTTLLQAARRGYEPQDIDAEEEKTWEVEKLVNSSRVKGVVQYQVQWTGCKELEDTCETFDHLYNCTEKLHELP